MYALGAERGSRCHFHARATSLPRADIANVQTRSYDGEGASIIRLRLVSKTYVSRGERVPALVDVHLDICSGETLGLVGESGSGKTTLAHVLMGLTPPDEGSAIELSGIPLAALASGRTREQLRALQIVFQNPDSALNRRHTVRQLISRSLARLGGLRGRAREVRLMELVAAVRMEPRQLSMRPAQLSGGLKQRVAIARAFAGTPSVVVCDEPTSALDVSVQAAILNLLADLQAKEQATYLFISHDLGVVRYLADRIAVLYLGRVVEIGPAEAVFSGPHHPYTEALLSAVPSIDGQLRDRIRLSGEIPSPADPPSGCVFHTRCPRRLSSGQCESVEPPLVEVEPGHSMACHILFDQLHRLQIIDRYDSV
jgi:peptide/nickel transport system ATP-binding protein